MKMTMAACLLLTVFAVSASAGEIRPYSDDAFASLQAEGAPILIDITASWCPTCRQQAPVIAQLTAEPEFAEFTVLKVDWDAQREIATGTFGAPRQSALLVYRGDELRARAIGVTSVDDIRGLLEKGLAD